MKGFSLIEVLVAFTIMAVSVGVLSRIYASGTSNAILGEEYAMAGVIADTKLAELDLEEFPEDAIQSGRVDDKYDWQIFVTDYEEEFPTERPLILLKDITVTVSWNSGSRPRQLEINTLKPVVPE